MDDLDEELQQYLIEAREHLADIETHLLNLEKAGDSFDAKLINTIFRAAHSIKGGSGFFGLTTIRDLAHKIENVLQLIRSHQLSPVPEVVNLLLQGFDKLRDLVNHPRESQGSDISELTVGLTGLTTASLPAEQKPTIQRPVEIAIPGSTGRLVITEFDYQCTLQAGRSIYLLGLDLIHDVHRLNKTPWQILSQMLASGEIFDCGLDFASVGTLADEISAHIPLWILFATSQPIAGISQALELDPRKVNLVAAPAVASSANTAACPAPAATVTEPAARPPEPPAPAAQQPAATAPSPTAVPQASASVEPAKPPISAPAVAPVSGSESRSGTVSEAPEAETTLRVQVNVLETLMNLAGELVLSRNQLLEALAHSDQRAVQIGSQRINLVTSELQEAIMQTRMQPIGTIFGRFPRLVRDLAKKLGKNAQLLVEGKDVEMDKTIIEGLGDPLTHMVRNSLDHGIETPSQRSQLGKPAGGTIRLNAYHEAGQVVVEIADDGQGIDPQKTASAALAKGLISKEQLKNLSEKEMIELILLPGLSTSDKVTDTSGRGVGMDVVKANLDRLGGKLEIETQLGKGTLFRIKLPLTLAIIPSLLVSVNNERFAIPQASVSELLRIPAGQVKKRIEVVGGADVLVLRGELIPLVHLASVLGVSRTYLDPQARTLKPDSRSRLADRRSPHYAFEECAADTEPEEEHVSDRRQTAEDRRYHASSDLNIVVVNAGGFRYGLAVEDLHDTVEIVVKALGRHLKGSREYAGATILGDGRVALILDASGLAAKFRLSSIGNSARARELKLDQKSAGDVQSFLLFRNAPEEVCAVPLSLVGRVEQIRAGQIEHIGGRRTMHYRGASLPLVALQDAAHVRSFEENQEFVVIVFDIGGREIGLLAALPVDVMETAVAIDAATLKQPGVMGSAILKDRTVLIVDIFELVAAVYPQWTPSSNHSQSVSEPSSQAAGVILLAEDSDFFRNQIGKTIEADGYTVQAAADGEEAWNYLQQHADEVRLLVTDIEMPRLDGLELTRNLRADPRFEHLPVIALTSLASEEDAARGTAAGVTDYQIKLDKIKLLASIRLQMSPQAATSSPTAS